MFSHTPGQGLGWGTISEACPAEASATATETTGRLLLVGVSASGRSAEACPAASSWRTAESSATERAGGVYLGAKLLLLLLLHRLLLLYRLLLRSELPLRRATELLLLLLWWWTTELLLLRRGSTELLLLLWWRTAKALLLWWPIAASGRATCLGWCTRAAGSCGRGGLHELACQGKVHVRDFDSVVRYFVGAIHLGQLVAIDALLATP